MLNNNYEYCSDRWLVLIQCTQTCCDFLCSSLSYHCISPESKGAFAKVRANLVVLLLSVVDA